MEKRRNTALRGFEVTQTVQADASECDINKIMSRALNTGIMPHVSTKSPLYGDFTKITNFRDALHMVRDAQTEFMKIPAKTRLRFGNDPQALTQFVLDPGNREEAIELGLIEKPAEKPPQKPAEKPPEPVKKPGKKTTTTVVEE